MTEEEFENDERNIALRLSAEAVLDLEYLLNRKPQMIPELIDLMIKYGWEDMPDREWGL